jgi:hypothetical protein
MKKFKNNDEARKYIMNKCDIYSKYILNDLGKDDLKIRGIFSTIVHVLTRLIYLGYPPSALACPLPAKFLESLEEIIDKHFTIIYEDLIENKKE